MDKKRVMIFSLVVIGLLFIAGCQSSYFGKGAVGYGGDDCPSVEYCNSVANQDNRCQTCYDKITMEGYVLMRVLTF